MRAEDVLPEAHDRADFNGMSVRKGTVAAFLGNARTWLDGRSSAEQREGAERDMRESLPALRALGFFELLELRDEGLRRWAAEQ